MVRFGIRGCGNALLAALFVASPVVTGCTARRPAPPRAPTLALEQATFRLVLPVEPDGTIQFSRHVPLLGFLDLSPILEAEGNPAEAVQVLGQSGLYVITAEGFRFVWIVTPKPGTPRATYRPVAVSDAPMSGVRLSRYGSAERVCVRVDRTEAEPMFLSAAGELIDACL